MSRLAVAVDDLGKRYQLGVIGTGTLREDVDRWWASLRGRPDPTMKVDARDGGPRRGSMWALRHASFTVPEGQTLGVIGANGAGKSTLLKLMSRVTAPSEGCIKLRGRVASLLEIGTGFHAELTGRENIFLNGAILGMRKSEVAGKFDEIVAFADVGAHIDTPVKRYSSGMYVRLAFAVAAHLEPDILIVDEVLAVGDVNFQKKCLGKMQDLTEGGHRTVLFVSHNMASIKALCSRAILLDRGRVIADGQTDDVVGQYLSGGQPEPDGVIDDSRSTPGTGAARFKTVQLLNRNGDPVRSVYLGQPFSIVVEVDAARAIPDAVFEMNLTTLDGTHVTASFSIDGGLPAAPLAPGRHRVRLDLDLTLIPGAYSIDLGLHHTGARTIDLVRRALDFHALNVAETGGDRYPYDILRGFVRPPGTWYID